MKDFSFDISVFEYFPVAIGIADLNGNILFINKEFTDLFGYTHNEIPTIEEWSRLAYPYSEYNKEVFALWEKEIKQVLDGTEVKSNSSSKVVCKNGETKLIKISFSIKEQKLILFFKDITDLTKAKEDAINEKTFADKVINSLPGTFYIYKKQGEIFSLVRWNTNFEHVSGYTHTDLIKKNPLSFFNPVDAKKIQESIYKCFNDGYAEIEIDFINKNGAVTPYHFIGYPFYNNEETYFIGLGIDISKQKETESNLETIFKAFPDIIIVSDYEGNVLYANESLQKQTGYSIEELQNKSRNNELLPAEDKELLVGKIAELLKSNNSSTDIIENRIYAKNGDLIWYSGVFAKTLYNGKPALLTISRNINKVKYSETALIESEHRMSAVFDSAPVIMMLINEKREILQINKKGIRSLNYNKSDLSTIPFGEAYKCINSIENPKGCGFGSICGECIIRSTIKDTFENGTAHEKVETTIHSERKDYHILLSSSLLKIGNANDVLLIIDDITERKNIEEDLKTSKNKAEESDKLKSAFLQNMSHEIRTPLNGILGFSSLLDNDVLSTEDRKYYIEVINQSSGQLLAIVDDILSLSKLETGQTEVQNEPVNINAIIQEIYAKYNIKATERNLVFSQNVELEDKQAYIYTDADKLRQILNSLLSNALKFTHKGHVIFGYRHKGDFLEFYVEDTGIGIESDFHNKIFDRFQQVDLESTRVYGGTGLGLTIAKANVELLKGEIRLESELETGSRFYFTIPYNPVYEDQAITDNTKSDKALLKNRAILVAEDEEINYLFIEEAIKDLGFKLIHVYDGIEAIEQCRNNDNIAIVLMDIKMPNMDGYEALVEIKKVRPDLPVIAQTAYAMLADKERALKAGFNAYLSKPIKSSDLIDTITSHIIS